MTHTVGSPGGPAPRLRVLARYALTAAGLLLLTWLLTQVDWPHLRASLSEANPRWLGVAVLVTLLNLMVKALRWQAMVRSGLGPVLPYVESLWMVPVGVAAGALTPARSVDLGKPALLVLRHDAPFARAVMLALWERLYDLAVLLLAGTAGAFILSRTLPVWRWPAVVGALVALSFLALVASPHPLRRLSHVAGRMAPRLLGPMEELRSVVASSIPQPAGPLV